MKPFIHDDFLLENEFARKIYHESLKDLPIVDYHCHLSPREIYEDKKFASITDAWLAGDHYKWRLLRTFGISEDYITGDRSDEEKFMKWAEIVPYLLGNPLYHWTHLELKQFFGIEELLSSSTANNIYKEANAMMDNLSARQIIKKSKVQVICTTDDPLDDLKWHRLIRDDQTISCKVLPTFRPDKVMNISSEGFLTYLQQLGEVSGIQIKTLKDLEQALIQRLDYFQSLGCKLSDHSLENWVFIPTVESEINAIFHRRLEDKVLDNKESIMYKSYLLTFLGKEYHKRQMTQQYHIGALRNVSDRMYKHLGPDSGFDAIGDSNISNALRESLNALDRSNQLPKTIIYTLNPSDFEVALTIMQGFQGQGIPGKMQFGSAWWFLDSIDGINKQINALASNGVLSLFIGMLTDSRSFLSFSRHDYFRRILSQFLGEQIAKGLYPNDIEFVKKIASDIAINNARRFLEL